MAFGRGGAAPMIDAGARDCRIVIQQLVESIGGSGLPIEDWVPLFTLDASRSDTGGAERRVADQLSTPFETRWGIEYRTDMDPDLLDVTKIRRLLYQGRVHDIVDAEHLGREIGIELRTLARRG